MLLQLVGGIRDGSQEEVSRVLQVVRGNTSLDEIRRFLARRSSSCEIEPVPQQQVGAFAFLQSSLDGHGLVVNAV